ncbi:MAG TPA: alpha/beta fold hydrolase [Paucimonas sp.]|nr:alpha/beta fold hydrolase [Paucimonas sp.]
MNSLFHRAAGNAVCLLLGALLAMGAQSAAAQDKTADKTAVQGPVPIETFFQPAKLQSVKLSPSGRWMAAQAGEPNSRVKLVMIDLEGKEPSRVIAAFSKLDVASFRWVNEDWLVFTVADKVDRSHKSFGRGLMSVRRDGEKMRLLIKRKFDSLYQAQGLNPLEPFNEMLALGAPGTNDIIVGEHHFDVEYEYSHTTLRAMDVSTGAVRTLLKEDAPPKVTHWVFDERGRPRAAVSDQEGQTTVFWADPRTSKWRQIGKFPTLNVEFYPAFVDDKDQLFVYTFDVSTGQDQVRRFDLENNKVDEKEIISTPGFDSGVGTVADRETNKIYGYRLLTDARSTVWLTPAMKDIQAKADALLPGRINELFCRPCDAPKIVLVYSYSDTNPGDYLLYRPETNQWQRLGQERPDIDSKRMARMEFHRTKARDGADLPVWITRMPGADKQPRPAVVLVHGGPWSRGAEWEWNNRVQFLASRGYVVIEPEFRGSTGYGERHFRAGWKQWGQSMQDDVTDALRFAIDKGWVDGSRVCIAGGSYGGYSTLMGLAKNPELYKCGIAWVAVTDPRYMYTVHWSDISEASKKYSMPQMIGDLKADAAMLAANAPIALADRIKAPLLLAYGNKDFRVPLVHGEDMRDALTKAGSPPEWVVYDGEGHGWSRQENILDFWRRVETFLAKHLK